MPSMQNRAIQAAASFASEKLGTKVGIDHITIGMLNHIKVRGFYVEDIDGDTLLYAGSVMARLAPFNSMGDRLLFSTAKAENVLLNLRETERGEINIKEVTDRLVNREKEKKLFKLGISSIQVDSVNFRLQRIEKRNPSYGVDYSDMHLNNIAATLEDFFVEGQAVGGMINALTFTERSGFVLDDLAGYFCVDRGTIIVNQACLRAEGTQINMPSLQLKGATWNSYKDFIANVRLDVDITDSYTNSDIIGYFAPAILRWDTSVSAVTASMHGTVANFNARVDNMRLADGGTIKASAKIKGLVDVNRTRFNIDVKRVDVTTTEFMRLLGNIASLKTPEKVLPYINRTERLDISGSFKGLISSFDATARMKLGSGGTLDALCSMHPSDDGRRFDVDLTTNSLNVARLLSMDKPINASFTAKGSALVDGDVTFDAAGKITDLLFNDYNYNSITFDANYDDKVAFVNVGSLDPNLKLQLQGAVDSSQGDMTAYNAVVEIEQANLKALNVNCRDQLSTLSASLSLDMMGRDLDTMAGRLSIYDGVYNYNDKSVESDLIELTVESNEDIRKMLLTSDFVDAQFESRSSYKEVAYYVSTLIARYLPQLYDSQALDTIGVMGEGLRDDVALLSVTTKADLSSLLDCIAVGLDVAPNTTLKAFIDPKTNRFVMRGRSECIERYPYLVSEVVLDAGNKGDSLVVNLGSSEVWAGALRLADFSLHAGAKDNTLDFFGNFADTVRHIKGELAARANISRRNGMRHLAVNILPSRIGGKDNVWRIASNSIEVDSSRVDIDNFRIYSTVDKQNLVVNGVASPNMTDSLQLELSNFALAPFMQFAQRMGYAIEGRTNGYVKVNSALKNPRLEAKVDIDSVKVNNLALPNLALVSRWDVGRSRAGLSVSTADKGRQVVRGYFSPSQARYYAKIDIGKLDVGLLDPLLKGVISNTGGQADIDLTLTGERRDASLNGQILVSDMHTTLDYTNCTYNAPRAIIEVKDNKFVMKDARIFDKYKNGGLLSMDLSLDHLSNIEYALTARFNDMLVLNTTKRENDMFYGNIYASGDVAVRGDKAGVKMDIAAISGNNSKFYMPLSGKANIASADFVTFAKPSSIDTTNYLVRRKMMFERRQRQRTSSGGGMDINMSLDVRKNAEVQLVIDPTVGDIIKGTGNGMLNLRINPGADQFEMYGIYTIDEGSYLFTLQDIINKKFVIERGSTIQWTGEPLDALLDIKALYRVKASLQPLLAGYVDTSIPNRAVPVNCIINLTDRLTKPTVGFDVQVPSADASIQAVIANVLSTPERRSQQFLYLLLANSFLSDSSTEAAKFGVSSAAVTGLEMLSNQLSNWLSSENSNIVLRYRPKTEQMMSDEVDFGFSHGLLGNRLLIEVEGNYLVDKSQVVNASSSFTGEAYVTWLIDQAGTLRLKGFTHTIDRFDENQGLQETGVGVYFKEDFDNAKDLKYRLKHRFSRRRRQERQRLAGAAMGQRELDNEAMESMIEGFDRPPQEDNLDNFD